MRKLLLVLLAFLAVFTYISSMDSEETEKMPMEKTVEITR
jgi:hypothetical protein